MSLFYENESVPERFSRALRRLRREILALRIDTLRRIRSRHPDFDNVRAQICAAGTDSIARFGDEYTHEGGLYLQQNADEFTALCLFLKERGPFSTYLEIGSASGGTCRFLNQQVGLSKVYSIDDGRHPRACEQSTNFAAISSVTQFIGDSHSEEAANFLRTTLRDPLEVVFIDGDHTFEGAWKDLELIMPHCRTGTLVILHDTVACSDVEAVWRLAISKALIKPVAEFVGARLYFGIGVGAVC